MKIQRLHVLLFAFLLLCFGYFYNGSGGNQVARLNQTRAIVLKGTLYSDGVGYVSDDQLQINGHTYSSKAPGTSLLGVPPYAIFNGLAWLVGPRNPVVQNIAAHLTTIVTVGVPCALMGVAFYLMLVSMGVSASAALLTMLGLTLGTNFYPYATMYFGHSLAAAFGFLSFYLLWEVKRLKNAGEPTGKKVLHAALLTSAAVVTEYPLVMLAGWLSLYLLSLKPTRQELVQWASGGAVGVILLLIYNTLTFGNPLALSYLNYARSERNAFPVHSEGLGGVTLPRWDLFKEILWGDTRGLIWFAPMVLLFIPGFVLLWVKRRDLWREGLVIGLMVLSFLLFNAGYGNSIRYWGGANSAGPRHVVPMLPFAALAIGMLVQTAPVAWGGLILVSVAVGLIVTSVMPQVPMLFGKPFEEFLFPYFLEGRLSVHRGGLVSSALVTEDSVAYSWGKLFGLPGTWALLPLFVGVLALLWAILRQLQADAQLKRPLLGLSAGLLLCSGLLVVPLVHQQLHARPLEGEGVRAEVYTERGCRGPRLRVERLHDLKLYYDGDDLRPYPGGFCTLLSADLEIPTDGTYRFMLRSATGLVTLEGTPLLEVQGKDRQEVTRELKTGWYRLEARLDVPVITQRVELVWGPPELRRMTTIPAQHLRTAPLSLQPAQK
ncbi:MAG: hypothetical protein ACKO6N_23625 [Myxococcota bacterium]